MSSENDSFKEKSIKQIQLDYFMRTLLEEKGWYWYERNGINANEGDLILFQMDNTIIASAIYDIKIKNRPVFVVKTDTIKIFEPITNDELSAIITDLEKFDRIKRAYDISNVNMELLYKRMNLAVK